MATIGIVGAEETQKSSRENTESVPLKIYFGVFFDGTGNNMVQYNAAKLYKLKNGNVKDWEAKVINTVEHGCDIKAGCYVKQFNPVLGIEMPTISQPTQFSHNINADYVDNTSAVSAFFKDGHNVLEGGRAYSNVAILHSIYAGMSEQEKVDRGESSAIRIYNIYVEGAGTDEISKDKDNQKFFRHLQDAVNVRGSGFGKGETGVVALVSKAIHIVSVQIADLSKKYENDVEIHFDVFGFSRGAACARLFSYFVAQRNDVSEDKGLNCYGDFDKYQAKGDYKDFLRGIVASVDFLGIFDTVSSIGVSYDNNTSDYGLFSTSLKDVKCTVHICALDEFREHFGLTDIGSKVPVNCAEIFIPGCHSDVGGGYVSGEFDFNLLCATVQGQNVNNLKFVDYQTGQTMDITKDTLKKLGWYDESTCSACIVKPNYIISSPFSVGFNYITFTRRVNGGYGNIPLSVMAEQAEGKKTGRTMFESIPHSYWVTNGLLSEIYAELRTMVQYGSRSYYFPNNEKYRHLRRDYLHFSAKENVKDALVHGTSHNADIICRYVYHGDKGDSTRHFFTDCY